MRTAICKWLLVVAAIAGCGPSSSVKEAAVSQSLDAADEKPALEVPSEHLAGQEIYTKKCSLCHDTGEAAAPRLGNPKQWRKRVGKSVDELAKNAFDGFEGTWGEMPPQGDDLSMDEIKSAVQYMLFRYQFAIQSGE